MTKLSIRRLLNPTKALQLALVLLVLASTSRFAAVTAQEEQVEEQQQEYQEPPPEDPVPPQQEEAPPVQEEQAPVEHEAPPVQEEAVQEEAVQEEPPVEEQAPPVQEEEPPVQEEEPPVVEEEAPPVVEEEEVPPEPPREASPPPIDDSLFEINVFECVAPRGDPAPKRSGPVPANSIMTLCFRPKNEEKAKLKSIALLEFRGERGPSQAGVKDNESAGPMTRAVCPMQDNSKLCIAATKLNEDFFTKSLPKVLAAGEVVVRAAGETRTVPFEYKFSTAEAPKQTPVDHEFFDFPATPPAFPCGPEIRIWLIAALILTLLEFAFSPDSDDGDKSQGGQSGGSKKKKGKKE